MSRDERPPPAKVPEDDDRPGAEYDLVLYIAGGRAGSSRAVANLVEICEERLGDRYKLEVVDLYQQPERAAGDGVIVAPTVIRKGLDPTLAAIGDFADADSVVAALGISER